MHLSSDLFLNASKLSPVHVSEADTQLNEKLLGMTVKGPRWWEVRELFMIIFHAVANHGCRLVLRNSAS